MLPALACWACIIARVGGRPGKSLLLLAFLVRYHCPRHKLLLLLVLLLARSLLVLLLALGAARIIALARCFLLLVLLLAWRVWAGQPAWYHCSR